MTRQADHNAKRKAAGWQRLSSTWLEPATVAALAELRTRGAKSDTAAVNAAVVLAAGLLASARLSKLDHGRYQLVAHEEATR